MAGMGVKVGDRIRVNYAVWGILAQLPEGGTDPISNANFMQAMKEIKERNPKLFAGMVFSAHPASWSTDLEQILFILGASGCLFRSPLDRRWYLQGVAEGFKKEFARHFTEEELMILETEGKALAKKIANNELAPKKI